MEKRWTLKELPPENEVSKLSEELNRLDHSLCQILIQRGIKNFDEARAFFRTNLDNLHDPFLMKDMDKAVKRLSEAIDKKERILIYGDYDVDGTTSVTLVYAFLENFYSNIDYYIPDRYKEGYGVSFQGIDYAADNEISLIIALDCGIKAHEKIDYAKSKGIDFIICDHHTPAETLPNAAAVLDPKREDCHYPFDGLSGCGVGFKFMQAFAQSNQLNLDLLWDKVDILAVSICADIVPMVDENRIFTSLGLQKLNQNPQAGFKAMLDLADVNKKELTVTDIVFTLAPRINAAGRIESGMKAVELMLSQHPEDLLESGNHIQGLNTDRKELDQSITQEAIEMIESDEKLLKQKTTLLYKKEWHKGVIGIVASRCIETYYRPTIILTESNGKAAGSARSVKGFNVYDAIAECSDLLDQFGGHKYAAGMTLPIENIEAFKEKFEAVVSASITDDLLSPEIEIDAELKLEQIDMNFYKVLRQFAPYGPQNMKPYFLSTNLLDTGYAKIVGNNHLKLSVYQQGSKSPALQCIAFNLGDKLDLVKSGKPFEMVYSIDLNEWQGRESLQLMVKDLREVTNDS